MGNDILVSIFLLRISNGKYGMKTTSEYVRGDFFFNFFFGPTLSETGKVEEVSGEEGCFGEERGLTGFDEKEKSTGKMYRYR